MLSTRNGGAIAAIVFTILLSATAPASAAPWDPALPIETEESLFAQVWQWLAGLFETARAGTEEEETSLGTCSALTPGGRGCAIDPNGTY
jgi:hypothetical protein